MTPEDFLRSITPGDIQPPDCGLDKFRNMTLEVVIIILLYGEGVTSYNSVWPHEVKP